MALTQQQRNVLRTVRDGANLTTQMVADECNMASLWKNGYDQAQACLTRLAARGLVTKERVPGPDGIKLSRWAITDEGRAALDG